MMLSTWLRYWKRSLERQSMLKHTRRRKSPVRRVALRPRLEALEDRTVPSTLTVTNNLDDGSAGSLRAAVLQANADAASGTSDAINFAPSLAGATITLTQGQLELSGASGSTITINGSGLSTPVAISGNNASRDFQVDAGACVSIAGLTIENGGLLVNGGLSYADGGGIYNRGALALDGDTLSDNHNVMFSAGTLTINGCTVSGGVGNANENIRIQSGTATISNTTFSDNGMNSIFNESTTTVTGCSFSATRIVNSGMITVSDCTLSGDSISGGGAGGAIYNNTGTATVTDCTLTDNSADYAGGAIANAGILTVRGCTLDGNSATGNVPPDQDVVGGFGGAIYSNGGSLTVSDCILSGNSALREGGAIYVANFTGSGQISDCTLSGNSAFYGGGIYAESSPSITVSGCTLSGNSAAGGGGIASDGQCPLTVTACTLSGNLASTGFSAPAGTDNENQGDGGGILSFYRFFGASESVTVSGCILSGNSADVSGGGIYNASSGVTTVQNASATTVYGVQTFDINSAVYGNQAPSGADLENLGTLNISHSVVVSLANQNPGGTTTSIAGTDSATALAASNMSGQLVYTVQVLAAQAGAATPTGMVTLYDGNNTVLGTATLDANGRAVFSNPTFVSSASPLHAVYSGDANFNGSTSAALIQAVNALTPNNLQNVVNSLADSNATAVELQASDEASWESAMNAINAVTAPTLNGTPVPITIVLNVAPGTYGDMTYSNSDPNVYFILNGSTVAGGTVVNGHSPALTVTAGNVTIQNITFTTATNAATIQVSGGHLTLRSDVVQSSTGYSDPAIAVSGGSTVDLGTASSPGGNTIIANGAGQVLSSTGVNIITTGGDTFQVNGATVSPFATVGLASSSNPSLLNQPITFTATVAAPAVGTAVPTGTVTFLDTTTGATLGVASLSGGSAQWTTAALPVNVQTVAAVFSGDANYLTSAATVAQHVDYHFGGFLAPLSANLAYALGRTVPIKFQLTDYNGAYISSLTTVTSLKVLNSSGADVLTGAGKTGLRYDATSNQYVFNWQTKGLAAGSYQIVLKLADGTTQTKTIQLTAGGSSAGLVTGGSGGTSSAGALLGGEVDLYVDNGNGDLTSDELARIQDAVTAIDATISPYGVTINTVSDSTQANVTLNMAATSSLGGVTQGVLGCTTDADQVTMVQGWNWYAGSDPTQAGSGQYDFETAVMHELGHVLGLGHSSEATSVMYSTLAAGTSDRTLTAADLNVSDTDSGPSALQAGVMASLSAASRTPAGSVGIASSNPLSAVDQLLSSSDLGHLLTDMLHVYQAELSSLLSAWQQADALFVQRFDALLSMGNGALKKDMPWLSAL